LRAPRLSAVSVVLLVACRGKGACVGAELVADEPTGPAPVEASRDEPCSRRSLPLCPPRCPDDYVTRCGDGCSDEGARCGSDSGSGMMCLGGRWSCFVRTADAARDECDRSCDPLCDRMDAIASGPCERLLGYLWNGAACDEAIGCVCVGGDCHKLWPSKDACEGTHGSCLRYQPCAFKSCGETCSLCDPDTRGCEAFAVERFCDEGGGCTFNYPVCGDALERGAGSGAPL
jgi:hypothetical protein